MRVLTSICLLIATCTSFAQTVATVLFTAKKVVANYSGSERILKRGEALQVGDTIITDVGATAKIKYLNGTLLTIGSSANYKILAYAPAQSDIQISAELSKGSIKSENTTGKKKEILKTPVVALAINGTIYTAYVRNATTTNVKVEEGSVIVGDVELTPGQSVVATPAGVSSAPFPIQGNPESTSSADSSGRATESVNSAANNGNDSASSSGNSGQDSSGSITSGVDQVDLISTTVVVGEAASGSTEASAGLAAGLATIEVIDSFPGQP